MDKGDAGIGLAGAALVALLAVVCCGWPLLLLALPALAAVTGQVVLISAALIVAAVGIGVLARRRRSGNCTLPSEIPPDQAQIDRVGSN
jgi:hypothetical protein